MSDVAKAIVITAAIIVGVFVILAVLGTIVT